MHRVQQFLTLAAGKREASSNTKEPTLSTFICKDQGMFKESSEGSTTRHLLVPSTKPVTSYCVLYALRAQTTGYLRLNWTQSPSDPSAQL